MSIPLGTDIWFFRGKPCLIGRRLIPGAPPQLVALDVSGKPPYPDVRVLSVATTAEDQRLALGRQLAVDEIVLDPSNAEAFTTFTEKGLLTLSGERIHHAGRTCPIAVLAPGIKTVSAEGIVS